MEDATEKGVPPKITVLQGIQNLQMDKEVELNPKEEGSLLVEDAVQKRAFAKANQALEEKIKSEEVK